MICFVCKGACVQNVLDSLVPALLADKNRKFIYVEQASSRSALLWDPLEFEYANLLITV